MRNKWIGVLVLLAISSVASCSGENEGLSSSGSALAGLPDANSADGPGDTPSDESHTLVVDDVRDSCVNALEPNRNYGLSPRLAVGHTGRERALIAFDSDVVAEAMASGEVTSASVEFRIGQSPNNWGPDGGTVSLYALTEEWSEWGSSWHCMSDANPGNSQRDCGQGGSGAWVARKAHGMQTPSRRPISSMDRRAPFVSK